MYTRRLFVLRKTHWAYADYKHVEVKIYCNKTLNYAQIVVR